MSVDPLSWERVSPVVVLPPRAAGQPATSPRKSHAGGSIEVPRPPRYASESVRMVTSAAETCIRKRSDGHLGCRGMPPHELAYILGRRDMPPNAFGWSPRPPRHASERVCMVTSAAEACLRTRLYGHLSCRDLPSHELAYILRRRGHLDVRQRGCPRYRICLSQNFVLARRSPRGQLDHEFPLWEEVIMADDYIDYWEVSEYGGQCVTALGTLGVASTLLNAAALQTQMQTAVSCGSCTSRSCSSGWPHSSTCTRPWPTSRRSCPARASRFSRRSMRKRRANVVRQRSVGIQYGTRRTQSSQAVPSNDGSQVDGVDEVG